MLGDAPEVEATEEDRFYAMAAPGHEFGYRALEPSYDDAKVYNRSNVLGHGQVFYGENLASPGPLRLPRDALAGHALRARHLRPEPGAVDRDPLRGAPAAAPGRDPAAGHQRLVAAGARPGDRPQGAGAAPPARRRARSSSRATSKASAWTWTPRRRRSAGCWRPRTSRGRGRRSASTSWTTRPSGSTWWAAGAGAGLAPRGVGRAPRAPSDNYRDHKRQYGGRWSLEIPSDGTGAAPPPIHTAETFYAEPPVRAAVPHRALRLAARGPDAPRPGRAVLAPLRPRGRAAQGRPGRGRDRRLHQRGPLGRRLPGPALQRRPGRQPRPTPASSAPSAATWPTAAAGTASSSPRPTPPPDRGPDRPAAPPGERQLDPGRVGRRGARGSTASTASRTRSPDGLDSQRTWVTGEQLTSGQLNTYIRDDMRYLHGDDGPIDLLAELRVPALVVNGKAVGGAAGPGGRLLLGPAPEHARRRPRSLSPGHPARGRPRLAGPRPGLVRGAGHATTPATASS